MRNPGSALGFRTLFGVSVTALAIGCGGASPPEDVGASAEALEAGEYVSTATGAHDATYIGDWEHDWGYVLGYLLPGAKIYAQVVTEDSVYGLIGNSGYGAWDHGHHCGWVSLQGVRGSGAHSNVADIARLRTTTSAWPTGSPADCFAPAASSNRTGRCSRR